MCLPLHLNCVMCFRSYIMRFCNYVMWFWNYVVGFCNCGVLENITYVCSRIFICNSVRFFQSKTLKINILSTINCHVVFVTRLGRLFKKNCEKLWCEFASSSDTITYNEICNVANIWVVFLIERLLTIVDKFYYYLLSFSDILQWAWLTLVKFQNLWGGLFVAYFVRKRFRKQVIYFSCVLFC